jgi:hypothetical protein
LVYLSRVNPETMGLKVILVNRVQEAPWEFLGPPEKRELREKRFTGLRAFRASTGRTASLENPEKEAMWVCPEPKGIQAQVAP